MTVAVVTAGSVSAVIVGATLLLAGATKLVRHDWRAEATALGVPAWIAPVIGPVEMVIGSMVAVRVARLVFAVAAFALLMGFTAFLLSTWEERKGMPCNCFGPLSNRPVSARTIVRNLVLLALTLVAGFAR